MEAVQPPLTTRLPLRSERTRGQGPPHSKGVKKLRRLELSVAAVKGPMPASIGCQQGSKHLCMPRATCSKHEPVSNMGVSSYIQQHSRGHDSLQMAVRRAAGTFGCLEQHTAAHVVLSCDGVGCSTCQVSWCKQGAERGMLQSTAHPVVAQGCTSSSYARNIFCYQRGG